MIPTFVAALAACGGTDAPPPGTAPTEPPGPTVDCARGWAATPAGECAPVLPTERCPAGTMPEVGAAACAPVGPSSCPAGFTKHASGWGCAPVVAPARCTGATREALGAAACVPVGDCARAFPPADATHFVDATYSDAQLDGLHFRTVAAAIAQAPPGSVIAVFDGTYPEAITLPRALRVEGRCAERVTLSGGGRGPGVAMTAAGSKLVGVRLSGYAGAIVARAARLEITDVVIEGGSAPAVDADAGGVEIALRGVAVRSVAPRIGALSAGLVAGRGATLTVTASTIADAPYAGVLGTDMGTKITVTDSILRDGAPDDQRMGGVGVFLFDGALATVERSWLHKNLRGGVMAFGKGAAATVRGSVVDETQPPARAASSEAFGHGLVAFDSASFELEGSSVRENVGIGVRVAQGGRGVVRASVIQAQRKEATGDLGSGAYVHLGSTFEAEATAFVENHRAALEIFDEGTTATARRCLFSSTRPSLDGKVGLGLYLHRADARVEDSAFTDNRHTGIYLWEARSFALARSVVEGTRVQESPAILGHGMLVQGVPSVTVSGSVFRGNESVGLVFSDSAATVSSSYVAKNGVGIHAQDGSNLEEIQEVTGPPRPLVIAVDGATRFAENGARVGSGVVPLGTPLDPR